MKPVILFIGDCKGWRLPMVEEQGTHGAGTIGAWLDILTFSEVVEDIYLAGKSSVKPGVPFQK